MAAFLLPACSVHAVCISCGSGSSSMTMDWNMSGATDERNDSVYCVGQPVSLKFWGLFSRRILDDVKIYALYNGSRIASNVSGYDGVASFTPRTTGSYRLLAERHGYGDVVIEITVGSCVKEAAAASSTTTTSSTSSTTTSTSTTSTRTTTSTSSTTLPQAGASGSDATIFSAVFFVSALVLFSGAVFFLRKRF